MVVTMTTILQQLSFCTLLSKYSLTNLYAFLCIVNIITTVKKVETNNYFISKNIDLDSNKPIKTIDDFKKDDQLEFKKKDILNENIKSTQKKNNNYITRIENKVLTIDIVFDIICPWCYIGKRRLERAVDLVKENYDIKMRWHAFELNPDMPMDGMDRKSYRTSKFGSWKRSQNLDEQVTQVGRNEGILFKFDNINRTPNTFIAHKLVNLAQKEGSQKAKIVIEELFHSYFVKGLDIENRQILVDVSTLAGMDAQKVSKYLEDSKEGISEVKADEAEMKKIGVDGVPYYIINNKYSISGAQDEGTLISIFQQAVN